MPPACTIAAIPLHQPAAHDRRWWSWRCWPVEGIHSQHNMRCRSRRGTSVKDRVSFCWCDFSCPLYYRGTIHNLHLCLGFRPIPNLSPLSPCISTTLKFFFSYRGKQGARCEKFLSVSERCTYGNRFQGLSSFSTCPYFLPPSFYSGNGSVPTHGR